MTSTTDPDSPARPVSVLVTVTRTETAVSIDGGPAVAHGHRGLTRAVHERLWKLTRSRAGRPSLTRFDPATSRTTPVPAASRYAVHALGIALGEAFFGGPAAEAVTRALEGSGPEQPVWVGIAVSVPEFAGIPWEAALLPGATTPLAMSPRVRFYRVPAGRQGPAHQPGGANGLRILAAFADPYDGPEGPALDLEADARRIVAAFEPGARQRHTDVEMIDGPDTVTEIRRAIRRRPCDILHLSCHARADALLLEDSHGRTRPVTARELANVLPAGDAPRLVVLAGCSTGAGRTSDGSVQNRADLEERFTGLAAGLVAAGVPCVLAMTAAVSDGYAAAFCAEVYAVLGRLRPRDGAVDVPTVLDAVAEARHRLEEQRHEDHGGTSDLCEWPTPALFLGAPPLPAGSRPSARGALLRPRPMAADPPQDVQPVARRAALRRLTRLWDDGAAGLIVYGLAGVGKSTLVTQFLRRLAIRAEDMVRITGAGDEAGLAGARRRVAENPLGGAPLIVVVDDVETEPLPDAPHARCVDPLLARQLADWADRPDRCRLIITSRHRLRLPGRTGAAMATFHAGPLLPPESRILISRLPGLSRFPDGAVERVLAEIGGHPAGLGHLDALVRGAAPVLPGLDAGLSEWMATEGHSLAAARSGGLGAAIRTTRRLLARDTGADRLLGELSPAQHTALVSLSVHRHPVHPDDLAAFPGTAPPRETIAVLESRGLLSSAPATGTGLSYFVCRWLATLLTGSVPPEQRAAAHEQAARHWLEIQRQKGDTTGIVLDLTESRYHFRQAGLIDDAFALTVALADRLRPTGAFAEVERLARESLEWTPLTDHATAVLHHVLGGAAQDTGRLTEARGHQERALALFTRIGFAPDIASAELELGTLEEAMGEYPAARRRYERALVAFTGFGDRAEVRNSRHCLGSVAILTGDTTAAREHYEALLELEAAQPDEESQAGTAAALHQLGVVEHACGRLDQAGGHYRRALAVHEQLGDRMAIASGCLQLALLARERGALAEATTLCRRAMRIGDEAGDVTGTAAGEHLLGMIAVDAGEPEQARAHYERALALLTLAGDRAAVGTVHHQLGVMAQGTGDTDRARDQYVRALTVAEDCGDRYGEGRSRHQLGLLAAAEDDAAGAVSWHRQALEIFEAIEDHDGQARALSALSALERLAGNPEAAFVLALRGFVAGLECGPRTPVATTALYELADVAEDLGDTRFRELLSVSVESSAAGALVEAVRTAHARISETG